MPADARPPSVYDGRGRPMDKFALEACCRDRLLPDEIPVPVDTHRRRLHVRIERHHPRPPADIVSDQTDP
jgi:hypothetical protein